MLIAWSGLVLLVYMEIIWGVKSYFCWRSLLNLEPRLSMILSVLYVIFIAVCGDSLYSQLLTLLCQGLIWLFSPESDDSVYRVSKLAGGCILTFTFAFSSLNSLFYWTNSIENRLAYSQSKSFLIKMDFDALVKLTSPFCTVLEHVTVSKLLLSVLLYTTAPLFYEGVLYSSSTSSSYPLSSIGSIQKFLISPFCVTYLSTRLSSILSIRLLTVQSLLITASSPLPPSVTILTLWRMVGY